MSNDEIPRGLGPAGRKLWRSVVADYELDEHESVLLTQACRTVAVIERLQAQLDAADVLDDRYNGRVNPLLPELRQQRLALTRMLKELKVPSADGQPKRQRRRWPNGYGIKGAVS